MMFKVIRYFEDLEDNGRPYYVGDEYPRDGLSVSDKRIKALLGKDNALGAPLIKKVSKKKREKKDVSDSKC